MAEVPGLRGAVAKHAGWIGRRRLRDETASGGESQVEEEVEVLEDEDA